MRVKKKQKDRYVSRGGEYNTLKRYEEKKEGKVDRMRRIGFKSREKERENLENTRKTKQKIYNLHYII